MQLCTIASAQLGQICAIAGEVYEVEDFGSRVKVAVVDDTGVINVTYFQFLDLARKFRKGDEVAIRGKVELFAGMKSMTNAQIAAYDGEGEPFEDSQKQLPNEEVLSKILANYNQSKLVVHPDTFLINKDEFGKLCELVRGFMDEDKTVCVVCPLACKTTEDRNAMVWNYANSHRMPELEYHPDICIDTDADCEKACKIGMDDRFSFYRSLSRLGEVHALSNIWKPCDVLVIEDADRFNLMEIDTMRKRANAKTFVRFNSPKIEQAQRLGALTQTSDLRTLFGVEFSYRRPGELERLA